MATMANPKAVAMPRMSIDVAPVPADHCPAATDQHQRKSTDEFRDRFFA
jgi:hypothetical protein